MNNKTTKYVIDFKNVKGHFDMFEIISTAMDFPDYFGNNWDAFWDCITDINGIPLYIEIHILICRAEIVVCYFGWGYPFKVVVFQQFGNALGYFSIEQC